MAPRADEAASGAGAPLRAKDVMTKQFLTSVIDNIPHMIFVKDAEHLRWVVQNTAGAGMIGHPVDELIGKSDYDFFPPEQAQFFQEKDREVLRSGKILDIPLEKIDTPSGERLLHTKKIPLFDDDGVPCYLLGISEDITERIAAEKELQRAQEASAAASVAKSEFLSRVSHELRTPLNAILGFTQLLGIDPVDDTQSEYVKHIQEAGEHLLSLINDVLDLSGIQSGRMGLSMEDIEVSRIFETAVGLVKPLAEKAGVRMPDHIDGDARCVVRADGVRLRQMLINLLTNAVKYNQPDGEVTVHCEPDGDNVSISIADTGRGIDKSRIHRIFDPFERVGAESTNVEGTGLGLTVCKQLAEAMNGSIAVTSIVGVGSTFVVTLPKGVGAKTEGPVGKKRAFPNLVDHPVKIVYVEDNPANVSLLRMILSYVPSSELIVADDGEAGLKQVREHKPDLVLLDIHLPGIQGDEVLRRLMDDPATTHIPVVMVSADATPSRVTELMGIGARDYVAKPFQIEKIFELVAEFGRTPAT